MFAGFLFAAATGVIWAAVGIVYSKAVQTKCVFSGFMLVYSIVFASVIWCTRSPESAPAAEVLLTAASIVPSSLLGILGFLALFIAMKSGSHALAWIFAQSAIIVPFLGGWGCFGNQVKLINWLGMTAVAVALLLVGKSRGNSKASRAGMMWSICALLLIGVGQFLTLVPGETGVSRAALSWRLPLLVIPGLLIWCVAALWRKQLPDKTAMKLGLWYGIIVAAGQVTLFMAIDQLGKFNISNVVHPAAISICIILFTLFCAIRRKEHLSGWSISGVVLLTIGTALLFC